MKEADYGIPKKEYRKRTISPEYLAGIFEIGGRMGFEIDQNLRQINPVMSFTDTREEKIERLKTILGGSKIRYVTGRSWRWQVKGQQAVALATTMYFYVPLRQKYIDAFWTWKKEDDYGERLSLAKTFENSKPDPNMLTPEAYGELIVSPQFMAGVYEARGGQYTHNKYSRHKDVHIRSLNSALLRAIQKEYGGIIAFVKTSGKGRVLRMGQKDSAYLLNKIRPHLLIEE